jgi:hypothetical protein
MRFRLGEIRLVQSPEPIHPKPLPPDKVVERAEAPPSVAKAPKPVSTALPVTPTLNVAQSRKTDA